ncbi:hypothetical protein [Vibrio sp. VB16]|uniref:hypothetical protein n=1 Tax=Vibrio sp. VB16 TaxID=2785746 RepID=UPI0018A0A34A|nr:hypothetical protein [Vibrio sp. VB16]UGA53477.1 hypothetical protein IUZ65_009165 [Vibrio sp. VB16]
MKRFSTSLLILCSLTVPVTVSAAAHDHSHNHYNPTLEQLGNDIVGLTVCYKNGYLSNEAQEPAFTNLINHADVSGEELGMYYMDKLGPKAEQIMSDEESRMLWNEAYCSELTSTYLDSNKLAEVKKTNHHDQNAHNHGHDNSGHEMLKEETIQQDIERGRLLSIN